MRRGRCTTEMRYDRELVEDSELVERILAALPAVPAAAAVIKTDAASVDLAIARGWELARVGIKSRIELIK